jgi:hypothetical protein
MNSSGNMGLLGAQKAHITTTKLIHAYNVHDTLSPIRVLFNSRFISVWKPFSRDRMCTTRRAIRVIVCLTFFATALNIPQSYFWHFNYSEDDCGVRPEVQEGGKWSTFSIFTWIMESLVFTIVPVAILLVNVWVLKLTRSIAANEERLLTGYKTRRKSLD